ncbi:Glycogen [starch] synthase [Aduncisulcus paluster]|uniref:Glycogen [starch] synthase n=1 Tax=Aduncisulcus paluster TaxID=2918883 RepID=A0ABQ5KQ75_9EUKA|nr:Glycogen [starch] synthase [Aduncisulcus paluster]
MDPTPEEYYLLDISLEVANRIGGINTVLKSKAKATTDTYHENYALIGPYIPEKAVGEFEDEFLPEFAAPCQAFEKKYNIKVHMGRWLVNGHPKALLFEQAFEGDFWSNVHESRKELLDNYGIPINEPTPGKINEKFIWDALVFGVIVRFFLRELLRFQRDTQFVMNFHEWLGSIGLIFLERDMKPVKHTYLYVPGTVFTTHATILGRHLAAGKLDVYGSLRDIDVDAEAKKRGIWVEHAVEKWSAKVCDVFTAVSDITGYESKCIHGREPDVITYNGLDTSTVDLQSLHHLHVVQREKIRDFVRGHFHGALAEMDMDKTLFFFISGRNEYLNKGADVFIEALAQLNWKLKEAKSDMTIVAFVIMPAKHQGFLPDSLEGVAMHKDLQRLTRTIASNIGEKIVEMITRHGAVDPSSLLEKKDEVMLKRFAAQLTRYPRDSFPSVVTHKLCPETEVDPIIVKIRDCNLFNRPEDRVKIVWHPQFITATSPLFGMDYMDFVRGCHLGVFPSYYEPFGLTPAECMINGVAAITTNVSGFGNFIESSRKTSFIYQSMPPSIMGSPRRAGSPLGAKSASDDVLAHAAAAVQGFGAVKRRVKIQETSSPALTAKKFKALLQSGDKGRSNMWKKGSGCGFDGIYVLDRRLIAPDESCRRLCEVMLEFSRLNRRDRVALRNRIEKAGKGLDWKHLFEYYINAHVMAATRANE